VFVQLTVIIKGIIICLFFTGRLKVQLEGEKDPRGDENEEDHRGDENQPNPRQSQSPTAYNGDQSHSDILPLILLIQFPLRHHEGSDGEN
jgi:hypothetical protein